MSAQGFRECKQTLWSLFQSYSFVDTARASPHSSADTSVGPHGSEGLVSKVVREPEFRSIMAAFTQRSTFERFFTLADDTDADDALLVERAMARLTSEATLVKLWAIMAKTRARLQRGAPPAALATTTHSAKGKPDWLMEEEDSLEALPRAQQTHQGVPLADIEVSPSVAVNWTVLSSVLYLYMHDSLRLRTVDEATIAKARAAIRVEGAASTGHADPTEDRTRDGVAATRMSIAVDADSYRPARETSEAPWGQQVGKPLAQPEQLHRKLDRAPLEALHRMLSAHNDAKSSGSGLTTARPSSICEEEDGSESRGRGTIEIPVEEEEGDEGHTDTPLRREPSPCVTTVLAGTAPAAAAAATAERPAAYRDCGSPAREEEEAVVPEQSGDSCSNNISPRKHHHTATPTRRTRQQRQEEALRRLATPKRRQCGDNGEATPPKQQQQQQQCRPVTPRRRNAALPKTPTTPMPLSSEEEPRRLLPSPSKLCSSGPRGVGNGIAGGGTGPDTTGVGSGGGSSRELRKPAPPPRRKHTQKEAAAASVIRRRGAEDEEVLPNTEGLRSPQQQQPPLLHRTVPERLARMPPARSPSPAFPLDLANALEDAGTSGSPRSSGSVTVVKEGEGIATAETGQLRGASRSPPPRQPHAHAPHKHMAYISQNTGTTTTTTGSHASGGLRQREPSEANQWSGRSGGKAGQKREAAPVPNAHTSEANATLTGATHANTGTPFMIRTRGRTGGAAGTNTIQPERQRKPLHGRHGGPSLTALPQPEQHVPAVGVAADPVRSPSSASMNEGRRTTALPVEASDINDRATPPPPLQPPLVEPHGENGDFDVDALTAKPGVGSEHGGHNATAAADSHSAPTSEGEELPPTALSRARLRVPSPQRVATAPSVSITPREVHGGGRGDGFFVSMPPPTTRESPLDHRCNGGGAAGRHLPLGDEQRQHSSHAVGGHQHRGLANEAVAGVSAGQQQQQQSHAPMETREPRLTGQDELAEDTTEGPVPYPEPPGLRPTMFLRAAPYSHLHGARSCHDSGGVHSNNNNNNNDINADVQCTPPKQVYHRDGGGGATGDARDRPSIRVTPGGDTEGEQSRLFTVAGYDADEHFYNLHNRTSVTPPSHNSTPHKAFVTPRCSCRSLRPPAMGNLSPTPRGNCDGLSPPPPARLSARARKLSRSASRGSRRLCNDDEANSTGSITAPRVPLTRCHSSNAGGDLQVAVLVSPRRTCGGGGSSLAAMTALASSPLSPPASVAPRVSRQPPQPSSGMKQ